MRRRSEYGGFPAVLLTFSLLLLVLAVGFVVGRLVVARAYLDRAPKLDPQAAQAPEVWDEVAKDRAAVPGRVYVPPPAPPERPPGEGEGLVVIGPSEETSGQPAESSQALMPQTQLWPREAGDAPERTPSPERPKPVPEPAPVQQPPTRPPVQPVQPSERVYSIQVGVFASREGARQVVDELARSGYQARIAPEKRGDKELYRVLTGRYREEYAARKTVEQLRADGFEAFLVQH